MLCKPSDQTIESERVSVSGRDRSPAWEWERLCVCVWWKRSRKFPFGEKNYSIAINASISTFYIKILPHTPIPSIFFIKLIQKKIILPFSLLIRLPIIISWEMYAVAKLRRPNNLLSKSRLNSTGI